MRRADLAVVVELELARLDVPVGIGRAAGRPRGVLQAVLVLALEVQHVGLAAARHRARRIAGEDGTAGAGELVLRRLETSGLIADHQRRLRPADGVGTAAEHDVAFGHHLVGRFAVGDLVGGEHGVVALQLGLALGDEFDAARAVDAQRADGGGAGRQRHGLGGVQGWRSGCSGRWLGGRIGGGSRRRRRRRRRLRIGRCALGFRRRGRYRGFSGR